MEHLKGEIMKKKIAFLLVFSLILQIVSPYGLSVRADERIVTLDTSNSADPVVQVAETNQEEVTGSLAVKLNLVYPVKRTSLAAKKFTMEIYSKEGNKESLLRSFPIEDHNGEEKGWFPYKDKTRNYVLSALNESGNTITTEALISYFKLDISNLPIGEYFVKFTGSGYTPYTSKVANVDTYSQEVVVATDDARFMIGDANRDGKVDIADRKLVEDNLSTKSDYNKELDFNTDDSIDITDLAMVNRHIDVPNNSQDVFDTTIIMKPELVSLDTTKKALEDDGKTIGGNIEDLVKKDTSVVKITSKETISKEQPITLPIAFKEEIEMSQINISTPHSTNIEKGKAQIEYTQDNETMTMEVPFDYSIDAEVHAIGMDEGKNQVVINIGKKVPVKKVTIVVEKVKDSAGKDNYIEVETIEFLKDIVPANPQSDNGIVKKLEVVPGSNELTLNWERVANIEGYHIYLSNKRGSKLSDFKLAASVDTTSATLKNFSGEKLKNYDSYYMVVTTYNGDWESGISEVVTGIPKPDSRPLRPDNLKVESGDGYLDISWKKMDDTLTYKVFYKKESDSKFTQAFKNPISETKYTLGGLTNGTSYVIYITGLNEIGESNPSLEVLGTPIKQIMVDPGIPKTNIISRDKIKEIKMVDPGNTNNTFYPKGFKPESVIDGDYTTHWTALSWWRSSGFTVTFNEPHTMNFASYVPRLDGIYKNSIEPFIITVWGPKDDLSKPGKELFYKKKAKLFTSKVPGNDGRYAILEFPKTEVIKITVDMRIWDGARSESSLSELNFYDYYSLVDDISDLFEDDTYTQLAQGVTNDDIQELREQLTDEDSYYVDAEILKGELDLAQSLLSGNQNKIGKVIDGVDNTKGFQPLGISAISGEEFVVYASIPNGSSVELTPTQYFAEASAWSGKSISLTNGRNVISMPKIHSLNAENGGPVYFKYKGDSPDKIKLHVNYYKPTSDQKKRGVSYIPVLDLYNWDSMSENDRTDEIDRYIVALTAYVKTINVTETDVKNTTEVSLPNVLLSIPANSALKGITDGNKTPADQRQSLFNNVLAWSEFMEIMNTTNGVDAADIREVTRENIRYMRMFGKAFMYAAGSHVGVGYGSTSALMSGKPTSVTGLGKPNNLFGWGIAHEVGHNKDTLGHAEITNNIYSLFAQTWDGGNASSQSRVPFKEVFEKTSTKAPGFANNVFVQLGMYWQLHLAYDGVYQNQSDNFYYKVNKELPKIQGEGLSIDERFAIAASIVSNKNLIPFFEQWGMVLSEETKSQITALGLAEDSRALYYLDDSSREARITNKPDVDVSTITTTASAVVLEDDSIVNTPGNKVLVSWSDNFQKEQMQGYEISRNNKTIAFVEASENSFTDVLGSANNKTYTYEVQGISKLGTRLPKVSAGEVRISHDAAIDSSLWTWENVETTTGSSVKINMVNNKPQSISGIRIRPLNADTTTDGAVTIKATLEDGREVIVKELDFTKNDSGRDDVYLSYFNKPDTDALDTRIWTYDVVSLEIVGLPNSITKENVDFLQYPGDNIEIIREYIGIMGHDYVYDNGDGTQSKIAKGTLVIAGNYRGDPLYNIITLKGKYANKLPDLAGSTYEERAIDGYSLLFAEVPEDGEVSNISDGFFIFVPNIQKEAELQNIDTDTEYCGDSILPAQLKAELYRTDNPDGTGGRRLTSDTLWMTSPSYETMPKIIIQQSEAGE